MWEGGQERLRLLTIKCSLPINAQASRSDFFLSKSTHAYRFSCNEDFHILHMRFIYPSNTPVVSVPVFRILPVWQLWWQDRTRLKSKFCDQKIITKLSRCWHRDWVLEHNYYYHKSFFLLLLCRLITFAISQLIAIKIMLLFGAFYHKRKVYGKVQVLCSIVSLAHTDIERDTLILFAFYL